MDKQLIASLGDELYSAMRDKRTIAPLTDRHPDMSIDDAYHVSLRMLERRLEDGEKVIGKKIGVTSGSVQKMLGVFQPDFGYLTDAMAFSHGQDMPISQELIQPRAEGEIAFILKRDLIGPGLHAADVLRATECIMPCFEVVDSRIENWNIKIQDTVADNASCGLFVMGDKALPPGAVDLTTVGMVVERNGELVSTGAGAAALGSPLNCVAWLANTLGEFGIPLKAGEVILSGSLVPLQPVEPGDSMHLLLGGVGSASVRFT
jgi:2-oxopent-4-enoate/cis-2-oxohex-4-enoate hydratase